MKQIALSAEPELESGAHWNLQRDMCDMHKLTVVAGDRSVRVAHSKDANSNAYVYLEWDGCALVRAAVDPSNLGRVLKHWLLARESLSKVGAVHPNVKVLRFAWFCEEGRGVEEDFLVSWYNLESFYMEDYMEKPLFEHASVALQFIASLRRLGFDRSLRAGQSLWGMIVSRSRWDGLKTGQVFIMLDFQRDHVELSGRLKKRVVKSVICQEPEASAEVISLLQELAAHPID